MTFVANRAEDALTRIVVTETGCWLWKNDPNSEGYGRWKMANVHYPAHRFVYELVRGSIAHGLTLDHLCRKKLCVNPNHLDPVPIAVNIMRGEGVAARNARKTHCAKGHLFGGDNLVIKDGGHHRVCRICRNAQARQMTPVQRAHRNEWKRLYRQRLKSLRPVPRIETYAP